MIPPTRQALMALAGTLNPTTAVTDAKAFVAYLDSQPAVDKKRKMGTTGYCMGGPFVLRTAATFPGPHRRRRHVSRRRSRYRQAG